MENIEDRFVKKDLFLVADPYYSKKPIKIYATDFKDAAERYKNHRRLCYTESDITFAITDKTGETHCYKMWVKVDKTFI